MVPCGVSGDRGARGDVTDHAALRRHTAALPDREMIGQSRLARNDHVVLDDRAARDTDLCHHDAVPADADVVGDLDAVVDLAAAAHHRVAGGTAIHRGVGANLDVVSDATSGELRYPGVLALLPKETESRAAKPRTRADDDAVPEDRLPMDGDVRLDPAPVANPHSILNYRAGADLAFSAERHVLADHHAGGQMDATLPAGATADDCRGVHLPSRPVGPELVHDTLCGVGGSAYDDGGRAAWDVRLKRVRYEDHPGFGGCEPANDAGAGRERKVAGAGLVQRRDPGDHPSGCSNDLTADQLGDVAGGDGGGEAQAPVYCPPLLSRRTTVVVRSMTGSAETMLLPGAETSKTNVRLRSARSPSITV